MASLVRKVMLASRARLTETFVRGMSSQYEAPNSDDLPVCAYNEWDPLEEVIVGRAEGQRVPQLHPDIQAKTGPDTWKWIKENANQPHDPVIVNNAVKEVGELCKVLELEGVKVQRPEPIRWDQLSNMKTPFYEDGGYMNACPRDGVMVVGNEIIEAPVAWRSRMFEFYPYRKLFNDYFKRGALWTAAPKPTMRDELYVKDFPFTDQEKRAEMVYEGQFILTEEEVAFDAADAIRFGEDIFICLSHATNRSGVEWLRRHLGPKGYRVHSFIFKGLQNCHADATVMPLRPGLLLVCPTRNMLKLNDQPESWDWFSRNGWEVIWAPEPAVVQNMHYVSKWVSMNVLSIDEERVVIQKGEEPLKKLFIKHGLKPIEVEMRNAFHLGGAFHCWTVDIKRTGSRKNYF